MLAMFPGVPENWVWIGLAVTAVLSYFVGCLNGAVIISKYILQDDVRTHGSGNAGLTNFYRTFGGKLTLAVIAIDVVKMLLAVWFSQVIFSAMLYKIPIVVRYWSGLFCMLGHMFPCMFRFKGGKGILSGGTFVFLLDWRIAAAVWIVFLVAAVATRFISLGSCGTGITFPIASALVYQSTIITVMSIIMGGLILLQHRANLQRLLTGQESRFSLRGGGGRQSSQGASDRRADTARSRSRGSRSSERSREPRPSGSSRERSRESRPGEGSRARSREPERNSPPRSTRPTAHRPGFGEMDTPPDPRTSPRGRRI